MPDAEDRVGEPDQCQHIKSRPHQIGAGLGSRGQQQSEWNGDVMGVTPLVAKLAWRIAEILEDPGARDGGEGHGGNQQQALLGRE
jgi:hypothetical protein